MKLEELYAAGMKLDREDEHIFIGNNHWYIIVNKKKNSRLYPYVVRAIWIDGHQFTIRLQRLLMQAPADKVVDHKNGDTLDNRKDNLRICTQQQNMCNRKLQSNNTSGYHGVHKAGNQWIATIQAFGEKIYIGRFATPEQAHRAYVIAANKYHGDFSASFRDDRPDGRPDRHVTTQPGDLTTFGSPLKPGR